MAEGLLVRGLCSLVAAARDFLICAGLGRTTSARVAPTLPFHVGVTSNESRAYKKTTYCEISLHRERVAQSLVLQRLCGFALKYADRMPLVRQEYPGREEKVVFLSHFAYHPGQALEFRLLLKSSPMGQDRAGDEENRSDKTKRGKRHMRENHTPHSKHTSRRVSAEQDSRLPAQGFALAATLDLLMAEPNGCRRAADGCREQPLTSVILGELIVRAPGRGPVLPIAFSTSLGWLIKRAWRVLKSLLHLGGDLLPPLLPCPQVEAVEYSVVCKNPYLSAGVVLDHS